MADALRQCRNCNYERGSHAFLKVLEGEVKICMVCPNCGQSYALEWPAAGMKSFNPEKGRAY